MSDEGTRKFEKHLKVRAAAKLNQMSDKKRQMSDDGQKVFVHPARDTPYINLRMCGSSVRSNLNILV